MHRLHISAASLMLLICTNASPTRAHLRVTSHQTPTVDQKTGPCGRLSGGRGPIYTYAPGATITVTIDEYIPHPGWFRIAFDADGEDDFPQPQSLEPPAYYASDAVLLDNLDPHSSGGGTRSWEVTLPDITCDNCTLQIIQVMLDKLPYDPNDPTANDLYYACIDLQLQTDATSNAVDAAIADPTVPSEASTSSNPSGGCTVARSQGITNQRHLPLLWAGPLGIIGLRVLGRRPRLHRKQSR